MPVEQYPGNDAAYLIAELNARIRSLENKYSTLTERLLVVNQNMIQEYKKLMGELRKVTQDTKRTKVEMLSTQEIVKDIVKEMRVFAKKEDVKTLEKYLDLINIIELVSEEDLNKKLESFKSEIKNR